MTTSRTILRIALVAAALIPAGTAESGQVEILVGPLSDSLIHRMESTEHPDWK